MLQVAEFFALDAETAKDIVRDVGRAVSGWREAARSRHAKPAEIKRMASAFEHKDLVRALAL